MTILHPFEEILYPARQTDGTGRDVLDALLESTFQLYQRRIADHYWLCPRLGCATLNAVHDTACRSCFEPKMKRFLPKVEPSETELREEIERIEKGRAA